MTFDWRSDVLPLLLFLLLPLLCFPELFFRASTLYRGDLTWIHYPLRVLAAAQWQSGQVPLWNPYVLSGFPLLAEGQVGVLYPLNVLFLLPLPAYRALTLFVTLHFTLAAVFTYLLARLWGIGRAGATLAGLSFGFGGFLMGQVSHPNIMTGGAWLPLIFCLFVYALRSRRLALALLGGIPLALQALTAQPQIIFYTLVLLVGYALFESAHLWFKPSSQLARFKQLGLIWLQLILVLGSGLMLAAPQLLPTWELQQYSVRSEGLSYEQITFISLSPMHWLTLVLPTLFGNNVSVSYQGPGGNFEETYVYLGILPLVLVPFSWRIGRRPEVIFLWLTVLVGALLAMGGYTPLYRWLQHLPGFDLFRVPARWSLLVNLALALLAAFGLDAFLAHPPGRRLRLGLPLLWLLVFITLLGLWFYRDPLYQWTETIPNRSQALFTLRVLLRRGLFEIVNAYENKLILGPLSWWLLPAVALISRLGLAVIVLVAFAAGRLPRRYFGVAAIVLTALDLVLAGGSAVNRVKEAGLWEQVSGGVRYVIATAPADTSRFYSLAGGEEENIVAGLGQYFPSVPQVLAASGHASPLRLARYDALFQSAHPVVALSLTGAHYILNRGPMSADAESVFKRAYQDDQWYVYENPAALPRTLVLRRVVAVKNGEEVLTYLRQGNFDPRNLLILETAEPLPPLSPETAENDKITFTLDTPSLVELQVDLSGSGFLVLLDNDYPGWQVYVDGQPRTIVRADYFARAVYLENGPHTVRFIYRPASFQMGLVLCVLGLFALGGAGWSLRRRSQSFLL